MTSRPRPSVRRDPWIVVGTVESETETGVAHTIKVRASDGHMGCSCKSYRFSRGEKRCKHTVAFSRDGWFPGREPAHAEDVRVSAVVERESFTVTRRRGISFGGGIG